MLLQIMHLEAAVEKNSYLWGVHISQQGRSAACRLTNTYECHAYCYFRKIVAEQFIALIDSRKRAITTKISVDELGFNNSAIIISVKF